MADLSRSGWDEAQVWEADWWVRETVNCTNTYWEEIKQGIYAEKMGIPLGVHGRLDLSGRSVVDVGGGPCSMLLKTYNAGRRMVIDPLGMTWPSWVHERYKAAGIQVICGRGEDVHETGWDEVWIYNVLQHCEDPKAVVERAMAAGSVLRLHEWVKTGLHDGHIHDLTTEFLEECIGQRGVETIVWWTPELISYSFVANVRTAAAHPPSSNAFESTHPMNVEMAKRILADVQPKVVDIVKDPERIRILHSYEHEYMIPMIGWLIDVDGPPGPERRSVKSIFDVGAGWGTTMFTGLEFGMDVLGIDVVMFPSSEYRIEECDVLDLNALSQVDVGRRDMIVATELLEHLGSNPVESFHQITRRTGAEWFFISVPHHGHAQWWPMGARHYADMPQTTPRKSDDPHPYIHYKPWEMPEIRDFLSDLGFSVVGHRTSVERNTVLARRVEHRVEKVSGYARAAGACDAVGEQLIPRDWWSRRYEYPWAAQYAGKGLFVLQVYPDFGHPMTNHLSSACDGLKVMLEPEWTAEMNIQNVESFKHDAATPWSMIPDSSLDRIFAIGVIASLGQHGAEAFLAEAARTLKDDGTLLVSFPIPEFSLAWFESAISKHELWYRGVVDRNVPNDVLGRHRPSEDRPADLQGPPAQTKSIIIFTAAIGKPR